MKSSKGRLKGIVRLIPPTSFHQGMQVINENNREIYKVNFQVNANFVELMQLRPPFDISRQSKINLQVLVVEENELNVYPLKDAQWEKSIEHKEIEKEVEFVLEKHIDYIYVGGQRVAGQARYVAKVLQPKKRSFTEDDMKEAFNAGQQYYNFKPWFNEYLLQLTLKDKD